MISIEVDQQMTLCIILKSRQVHVCINRSCNCASSINCKKNYATGKSDCRNTINLLLVSSLNTMLLGRWIYNENDDNNDWCRKSSSEVRHKKNNHKSKKKLSFIFELTKSSELTAFPTRAWTVKTARGQSESDWDKSRYVLFLWNLNKWQNDMLHLKYNFLRQYPTLRLFIEHF